MKTSAFLTFKQLILSFFTVLGAIFAPIEGLVWTVILAVALDTILAIYVTVKRKGKESYKSHFLFNITVKIFFYAGAILLSHKMDVNIFSGKIQGIPFALSKAATIICIYIEVKSMDETQMKLGNKSLWVILGDLFRKIKSIKKNLNDQTTENETN